MIRVNQLENIVDIELLDSGQKYMIIFPNKNKGIKCREKVESDIEIKEELEKYLHSLNYKVILGREVLSLINETSNRTPPIYKMAVKSGINQVIIVK
jgi:hypothetical protein